MRVVLWRLLPLLWVSALSSGCATDRESIQFEQPQDLAIPPDLTRPARSGFLALPSEQPPSTRRQTLLPPLERVSRLAHNQQQWLQIDNSQERLWPLLEQFWQQNNIALQFNQIELGVMETLWFNGREQRFAEETRDKFRLRVIETAPAQYDLYLTHYGVRKVDSKWQFRPRDYDLEHEILGRLALSIAEQQQQQQRQLAREADFTLAAGELSLQLDYARAWRETGLALDRLALTISDKDRSNGLYFINLYRDNFSDDGFRLIPPDEQSDKSDLKARVRLEGNRQQSRLTIENLNASEQQQLLQAIRQELIRQEMNAL
ncbi:outer membrane protein assembly factor BamC [Ectothiorhodospiraceae bacterium BW-2]|nr:outer membrane protein assembly factor BamC [Ectothiorhodospiraceae bacterium BW-2]